MRFVPFGHIRDRLVGLRNSVQNGPNYCKCSCHEVVSEFFAIKLTRSTPFVPKLTFWCISYHLGAFGTVWLPYETRCKTAELVQKFVPRSRVRIFCNERTRSTPFVTKLTFWCTSYHLGAFGTVWLPYETRWKTGRTSANVRATKRVRIFRSERTRSTLFDPKLTFWSVL